jgi:membrane protease YdiL (CAAX protease family)
MLVNIGIVFRYGVAPLIRSTYPDAATVAPIITHDNAVAGLIGSVIVACVATALLTERIRRSLARFFPPVEQGGFNPASLLHMVALLYCVYLLGDTILNYLLAGGLSGLAQDFQTPTVGSVIEQTLAFVLVATLGTGLLSRRSVRDVWARLGLCWPTIQELWIGAAMCIALIGFAFIVGTIWQSLTPPSTFDQQTQLSQLIAQGVDTLTFAFIVAGGAAIGEEIAFRGALQPVFGLWPTAIFFALTHIQYTLTPAALLIFGVALGLGWLRRRYNTTTSMVAHFLYDFSLLALSLYAHYFQQTFGGP